MSARNLLTLCRLLRDWVNGCVICAAQPAAVDIGVACVLCCTQAKPQLLTAPRRHQATSS
jgi:hypothetical protein